MEKTRTLFNVAVLFVLVLFGSVVPASAQDGSGMEDWQIILSILGPILGALWYFHKVNKEAHDNIGENIKGVKKDLGENIDRVEGKVDGGFRGLNSDIKDLNRSVGRLEGSLQPFRRPSEDGQD